MKLRLVVLGMMGRCPFGGQTWLYLNWLRGLSRLGHDVWYVEDDTVWPYDPEQNTVTDDCSYAVRHLAGCMARIGLPDRWAFTPEAPFFTTIGNYRQEGSDVEYNGQVYRWSKHHEWEKFLDLPRRTTQPFELAMRPDDPADRARLEACGWRLVAPFRMSLDI